MTRENAGENCLICVDTGTTNTRVWLTQGDQIIACAQTGIGVRDTARDGSSARLRNALRELIEQVRAEAINAGLAQSPSCVIAAGMITSPLGLIEVPHVRAPAGLKELAASTQRHSFPEITDLPILLIPGVRSGPPRCDLETVGSADVMRGEETLCLGLNALGLLDARSTLLNLGSHWKVIKLDQDARIASSLTSMTGELIHTAQTQTILASSVPNARPAAIDQTWLDAGMREQRKSGLARALFCVRLLEQASDSAPEQRLSFLVGAFLASDMDAMISGGWLSQESKVVITGGGALAETWRNALTKSSIRAIPLSDSEVEGALLAGCRRVFSTKTVVEKIAELAKLPENWDEYGSRPIQLAAIERSIELLRELSKFDLPLPQIFPVPGGGIQLEWQNAKRALEIEILSDGSVEFLIVDEEGEMREGQVSPYSLAEIHRLVHWLFSPLAAPPEVG